MALDLAWQIRSNGGGIAASHPSLPGWSIDHWSCDFEALRYAMCQSFLKQMLDDRPIELERAAVHRLEGWVMQIPVPMVVVRRCELWDAFWHIRVTEGVPEDRLCRYIGVASIHDVVTRLSPLRVHESWSAWHGTLYKVLNDKPWDNTPML